VPVGVHDPVIQPEALTFFSNYIYCFESDAEVFLEGWVPGRTDESGIIRICIVLIFLTVTDKLLAEISNRYYEHLSVKTGS